MTPPRLLFPHGLGDNIQAIPAIRALAARYGPVDIAVMYRIPAIAELWRTCPYVREVHLVEDPWRDGPEQYPERYREAHGSLPGADWIPVWTARPDSPTSPLVNKTLRICAELGVEWDGGGPSIDWLDSAEIMRGFRWAKEQAADRCALVLVHGRSGNPPKDMTYAQIRAVEGILGDLGLGDKPRILVWNKVDRLDEVDADHLARHGDGFVVSALDRATFGPLLLAIERMLWQQGRDTQLARVDVAPAN